MDSYVRIVEVSHYFAKAVDRILLSANVGWLAWRGRVGGSNGLTYTFVDIVTPKKTSIIQITTHNTKKRWNS
jgi:hypothetical protein